MKVDYHFDDISPFTYISYQSIASHSCSQFIFNLFNLHTDSWDPSYYNASVNVPFGIAHYKSKLFVAVPRRNRGVPSTLNVVELSGNAPYINPLLRGYPNYQMNTLNVSSNTLRLHS